jgi:hypothetical protein
LAIQFLRPAAELHSAQFRDQQRQVLDLGAAGGDGRLLRIDDILQMPDPGITVAQHGLQGFDVIWKGIVGTHDRQFTCRRARLQGRGGTSSARGLAPVDAFEQHRSCA